MDEKQRANTTALPIDHRPEVRQEGAGSGSSSPISHEQDKTLRDGGYSSDRFDDQRMRDLPADRARVR